MTTVIIKVQGGMVQAVYCRNKNIDIEIVDLNSQDEDEVRECEKRIAEIERSKTYKNIL